MGRQMWRKLYGPVTPGDTELRELAAVVNKITGQAEDSVSGGSPAYEGAYRPLPIGTATRGSRGLSVIFPKSVSVPCLSIQRVR